MATFLAPVLAAASFDTSAAMNAKVVNARAFQCEHVAAVMYLTEVGGKNYVTMLNQEGSDKRAIVLEYSAEGDLLQGAFGSVEKGSGGDLELVRGETLSADEAIARYGTPCAFLESRAT
jgi:hypothetical protein